MVKSQKRDSFPAASCDNLFIFPASAVSYTHLLQVSCILLCYICYIMSIRHLNESDGALTDSIKADLQRVITTVAVSYTHLDVYKRQENTHPFSVVQFFRKKLITFSPLMNHSFPYSLAVFHATLISLCLLYTSRCV